MGMAIKSLESSGYSDRIAGEENRSCTAIKSLGVEADQMDTAIESMVDRDVIAGVHGRGMAAVWLLYGRCISDVWLLYGCHHGWRSFFRCKLLQCPSWFAICFSMQTN